MATLNDKNKHLKTRQMKIDQWSACDTPKVWRSDSLVSNPERVKGNKGNKNFYKEGRGWSSKVKGHKAKIILSKENAIREINGELFFVRSQTGIGEYKVQWNGKHWVCNCPDFVNNSHIGPCKHIVALEFYFDYKYDKIKSEQIEPKVVTYSQDWSRYNQAQVMEFELFDQFLYQLVSMIEEPEQHMGRPRHKMSDLIFCCITKMYGQLSSRRSQHLFIEALQRQQISKDIHYNAVSRTLLKKELTPLLVGLVHLSAEPLASLEADFAIDSSGFRCSTFGAYCRYAHGEKRMHNWLKAHICTGVYTNVVTDIVVTDEHVGDSPQLKKLLINTARSFGIREVSADMAYSSRKNLEIVDKFGGTAYIPFKKNATGRSGGSALWRKTFHYFQLHKDEFMEHYHKRSNAESTFAAIKKKFGESVKSKNRTAQINELLCKIIAYNITVLIREMIELDGISDFMSFDGLKKEVTLKKSNGFRDFN